jgi:hypothetical protein
MVIFFLVLFSPLIFLILGILLIGESGEGDNLTPGLIEVLYKKWTKHNESSSLD